MLLLSYNGGWQRVQWWTEESVFRGDNWKANILRQCNLLNKYLHIMDLICFDVKQRSLHDKVTQSHNSTERQKHHQRIERTKRNIFRSSLGVFLFLERKISSKESSIAFASQRRENCVWNRSSSGKIPIKIVNDYKSSFHIRHHNQIKMFHKSFKS